MKPRSATAVALYLVVAVSVCGGALAANLIKPAAQPSPARAALAPGHAVHPGGPVAAGRPAPGGRATTTGSTAATQSPARVNASVASLPGSGIAGEPSIAIDSTGTIFVTGPTKIGHSTSVSASPLWKSSDGGATWTGPVSTETNGQTATGIGGGDSDIVVGPGDGIYVTSLWLGNAAMAVSTDHGATFTQLPIGHLSPVDDRPWLYYDPTSSALYMDWDGAGALHVGKALLGATTNGQPVPSAGAQGQLVFEQDVPAVANEPDRGCGTCPPGNVIVEPSGIVDVAFAGPQGVGVASSADGIQWGAPTTVNAGYVPNTAGANVSNNFQVLRSDNLGNLYLVWTQQMDNGSTTVFLSYRRQGAGDWHAPIRISNSNDAMFGTVAVVSPGVVDVAYYGSSYSGDPNAAGNSAAWDLYLAQVQNLFGSPSTATADLLPGMHHGSISTQGLVSPSAPADRRLGDFFSIAIDGAGLANIITVVDDGSGTKLQFVHESPPPPPPAPGLAFVLPTPPPTPGSAAASYPHVPNFPAVAQVAPTPDAATPAPVDAGTAAAPSTDTGTTGRPSGPKYPDGVGISSADQAGGGTPGHGPPLWAYGLAGVGATLGRLVLKRGRG